MVSDPYLFHENASDIIANGSRGPPSKRRTSTRHFSTVINIGSFDRNANPGGLNDEFSADSGSFALSSEISKA
jgi:hypothetical protein